MIIDRRALAGAALGAGAGIVAEAKTSEDFDEGLAVQRVYDADGRLLAVDGSNGAEWVSLFRRE